MLVYPHPVRSLQAPEAGRAYWGWLGPTIYGIPPAAVETRLLGPLRRFEEPYLLRVSRRYSLGSLPKSWRQFERHARHHPELLPRIRALMVDHAPWFSVPAPLRAVWHRSNVPIWYGAPMHAHTPPLLPLGRLLDPALQETLPPGSGPVLDTRHLAYLGLPLPLPDGLAALLKPVVRAVVLSDVPPRQVWDAMEVPACIDPCLSDPWPIGSTPRWSTARWRAFLAQWAHVPCLLPTSAPPPWEATSARDMDYRERDDLVTLPEPA